MTGALVIVKRLAIFVHRWVGAALALMVLLWFGSGIVMMYRGFPTVTPQERLQRTPTLDPDRMTRTAGDVFGRLDPAEQPSFVLVTSFDDRPAFIADGRLVYADDGTEQGPVDGPMIDRAAAAWSGQPLAQASKHSVEAVDQWTVTSSLRRLRPLYKYSWPDGQQVYVDGRTADVVQYTTRESRFWAYLGAIPHWLYFLPLRTQDALWFRIMLWSALAGCFIALLGVVIGLWMYSPRRRYRIGGRPARNPYRGWKRWHMAAGLLTGVTTATWLFSGVLTMGPFPIMDRVTEWTIGLDSPGGRSGSHPPPDLTRALRGGRLDFSAYAAKSPAAAVASLRGFAVKELEYISFDGEAMYLATDERGDTRIVPVHGEPRVAFDTADLMQRLRDGIGVHLAGLSLMETYDAYYLDRRGQRPLPVIAIRLNDAVGTRYYLNPRTATMVGGYSSREWITRWLYRGLHSFDFPWLYNHRPLWDVVVITLLLGGAALSATSLVLAYRLLVRTLAAAVRARLAAPEVELAATLDHR